MQESFGNIKLKPQVIKDRARELWEYNLVPSKQKSEYQREFLEEARIDQGELSTVIDWYKIAHDSPANYEKTPMGVCKNEDRFAGGWFLLPEIAGESWELKYVSSHCSIFDFSQLKSAAKKFFTCEKNIEYAYTLAVDVVAFRVLAQALKQHPKNVDLSKLDVDKVDIAMVIEQHKRDW